MADAFSIEQLLPLLLLCCMIPICMQSRSSSGGASATEMDIWFTGFTAQEAYDAIIKETDELREKIEIEAKTKKLARSRFLNRFPSLKRPPKQRYVVKQMVTPNIYRISDEEEGPMYFDISDAEDGGAQVKVAFSSKNKEAVQGIKARMPSRKLVVASKNIFVCPSCGKTRLPEWQLCPYCGSKFS
ncbi:hypothetical protein MUP77_20280 [Candidatus Bathyarchaeota archaeon]|nr:hypothetical protein [Candidatus Bathyarchaeota archaeon]